MNELNVNFKGNGAIVTLGLDNVVLEGTFAEGKLKSGHVDLRVGNELLRII